VVVVSWASVLDRDAGLSVPLVHVEYVILLVVEYRICNIIRVV
jgi:hypothetical protein